MKGLVQVTSTTICGTDLHTYDGRTGASPGPVRSASCLRARPHGFRAAYGYAGMGPYRGDHASLLRVLWADVNCIRLPGEPGGDRERKRGICLPSRRGGRGRDCGCRR